MSTIKDGGPAFARTFAEVERDRIVLRLKPARVPYGADGMSLRDYFAAKTMQGLIAHARNIGGGRPGEALKDTIARQSFAMADAMLKAREGGAA